MFLHHPPPAATNGHKKPDRLERLQGVHDGALALAEGAGNPGFVDKLTRLHDHKGTLIVFRHAAPAADERDSFTRAWASKAGGGAPNVEHEY